MALLSHCLLKMSKLTAVLQGSGSRNTAPLKRTHPHLPIQLKKDKERTNHFLKMIYATTAMMMSFSWSFLDVQKNIPSN